MFDALIPNPNLINLPDHKLFEIALNYFDGYFREPEKFVYEDKSFIVQDFNGNIYTVLPKNSNCIACKYILSMLNNLANELKTTDFVVVPMHSLVNFFELYKYLPIGFDNFMYYFETDNLKIFKTHFNNKNKIALLANLPIIQYYVEALKQNCKPIIALLYSVFDFALELFSQQLEILYAREIMLHRQQKLESDYLPEEYKQSRNKLLIELMKYSL